MRGHGPWLVLALLSISAPAAAQEWTEYANLQDGFQLNFPGRPSVTEITWTSQLNYTLPARVYKADKGRERYSLTVVDYTSIEQQGVERAKTCPPGNANCRGNAGATLGAGYAKHDERGAIVYATSKLLQRDAKLNYLAWEWQDMVEGHLLHLTNHADQSRTFAWIGMHAHKLYILEGTVPAGAPEPGLFQQSMVWLDKDGNTIRYQTVYSNSYHGMGVYPVPPLAGAGRGRGAGPGGADPTGRGAGRSPGTEVVPELRPPNPGQNAGPAPAGPAPGETLSQSYRSSQSRNVDYQKVAPIKVFDNLYYVGPGSVSVWLIPTTDGLILIDSAQEPLVDHVIDSIRKVGFDPKHIKYILLSHGHLDHFGGAAKIQQVSGARVATLEEDWQLIEAAGKAAGRGNAAPPLVPTRDMVLKDGQVLTLGKTSLRVHRLPGHTAGSASFAFTVYDEGKPHTAFLFGGPGQRNGVEGGMQFLNSIRRIKRELADIEVPVHVHSWLTTHPYPGGGAVFEPALKLAQRKPGEPHAFVDNARWRTWLDAAETGTIKYIEDEKGKAQRSK